MAYCTPADLVGYLPERTLAQTTNAEQLQACDDASAEADSYLRGRYALPLSAWGADVTRFTAWIACYLLMTKIGFTPQANSDQLILDRYYQAVGHPDHPGSGWFPGIQRQAIHPDVTPAQPQPGDAVHDVPQVITTQQRGWQTYSGGKPTIQ